MKKKPIETAVARVVEQQSETQMIHVNQVTVPPEQRTVTVQVHDMTPEP